MVHIYLRSIRVVSGGGDGRTVGRRLVSYVSVEVEILDCVYGANKNR